MYFIVKVRLPSIRIVYLTTANSWFDAMDEAFEKYGLCQIRVMKEK